MGKDLCPGGLAKIFQHLSIRRESLGRDLARDPYGLGRLFIRLLIWETSTGRNVASLLITPRMGGSPGGGTALGAAS